VNKRTTLQVCCQVFVLFRLQCIVHSCEWYTNTYIWLCSSNYAWSDK